MVGLDAVDPGKRVSYDGAVGLDPGHVAVVFERGSGYEMGACWEGGMESGWVGGGLGGGLVVWLRVWLSGGYRLRSK